MQDFTIGQRWVSAGELQLGIGMVIEVEHRTVSIIFPATGEVRVYAKQSAPLSRVGFSEGDVVSDQDGRELRVQSVEENNGLRVYRCLDAEGQPVRLPEGKIDNFLQLNQPLQRLLNGQIDFNKWFELRARTQKIASILASSDLQGLTGCRTSLIDHQLYIAHEVANRHAPRVLLADEVGLGKTIEAGLILHQQLLTERARRVLIIVPESLQHQWLLEMMRRFNLMFSIFDEKRCAAIDEEHADADGLENPFHSEQLVLCSLEFVTAEGDRFAQLLDGEWDMLIVDEAHHLVWDESRPSLEYQRIEQLAQRIPSVLLLTATPEQLGKESHFARLRLLDPDRFSDLARFVEEEAHYREIADLVDALLQRQPLDDLMRDLLQSTLAEGDNREWLERIDDEDEAVAEAAREHLVDHLLDRHGVGRVLFRNTRHAVQGFPPRELHPVLLPFPDIYRELYDELGADAPGETGESDDNPQWLLSPEIVLKALTGDSDRWAGIDPRAAWLLDFLRAHRDDKVLVICSSAETALDLVQMIKRESGLPVAAFHEGLNLVERDRAAAWFADREQGAQALICSEIGSEGRNFQFAHQLVLFDLPWNPDLLEQRIGRLDRIGQTETIRIHVPCMSGSAQQLMMTWLHEALDAFEQTCPAGHSVFMQTRQELLEALRHPEQDHEAFIQRSAELHRSLNEQMQQGRDRLLEYNSCRPKRARELRERAETLHLKLDLPRYLESLYDYYGIAYDIRGPGSWVLKPTDNMPARVPGLPDDGMTVTYDRLVALANEDLRFLSWEHPFVRTLMDMVQSSELGNTALIAIKYRGVPPGSLLLDCFFRVELADRPGLQAARFLPDNLIRLCIDERGNEHQQALTPDAVHRGMQRVDIDTAIKVIQSREGVIKQLQKQAEQRARALLPQKRELAEGRARELLQGEIDRLHALRTVNPNVREDEIRHFEAMLDTVVSRIADASLRLDALRVMVAL